MLFPLPENALLTLLRRCYQSPRCVASKRSYFGSPGRRARTSSTSRTIRPRSSRPVGRRPYHQFRAINSLEDSNGVVLAATTSTPSNSSSPSNPSDDIAILGGGITGLASAFFLSKELPKAKITLYESSDRLGGWLHSKSIDVGTGNVLFEQGPRTIRPNTPAALVTLEMVYF